MISGHLQRHLQSCVATSLYAREVIMLYFTIIDNLYIYLCILQFLYSSHCNSEYNKFLVLQFIFLFIMSP